MNVEEELLTALKHIKENRKRNDGGICGAICHYNRHIATHPGRSMMFLSMFEVVYKRWPKYSGDNEYPIPNPFDHPPSGDGISIYSDAEAVYEATAPKDMWNPEHPYGALRLELLDFCIEYLEKNHG